MIDLEGKVFRVLTNQDGDVDETCTFYYHQSGSYVWGRYKSETIQAGVLFGQVNADDCLEFRYAHHQNQKLKFGICRSKPVLNPSGLLQLHEAWQWTQGDEGSGKSIIQEIMRQ